MIMMTRNAMFTALMFIRKLLISGFLHGMYMMKVALQNQFCNIPKLRSGHDNPCCQDDLQYKHNNISGILNANLLHVFLSFVT